MLVAGTANFDDLLVLIEATPPRVPPVIMAALAGLQECRRDLANGGFDQFVWNHGAERARELGRVWREVGAVENGDLLCRLAEVLETQRAPTGPDEIVDAFFRFRRQVGGPEFPIPSVEDELEEALLEWALERPELFG